MVESGDRKKTNVGQESALLTVHEINTYHPQACCDKSCLAQPLVQWCLLCYCAVMAGKLEEFVDSQGLGGVRGALETIF